MKKDIVSTVTDYTIEIIEEVTKEGESIINSAAKTLYRFNGGVIAEYAKNKYYDHRFLIRLQDFVAEEELIGSKEKKEFYENIDKKKLDFLFEILDKTRSSAFDLHAKILSKMYANFLNNNELDYFEVGLITNINTFHEDDFQVLYNFLHRYYSHDLSKIFTMKDGYIIAHTVSSQIEENALNKFINIGILIESKHTDMGGVGEITHEGFPKNMKIIIGKYGRKLYDILVDIGFDIHTDY